MTTLSGLTAQQLRRAADLTEQIDQLQGELNKLLGHAEAKAPAVMAKGSRKRQMSAAGRARIAAAAKARWAALRKSKAGAKAEGPATKKKRKFSPAARAKLAAAAKERWAKAKAEGKAAL